MTPQQVARRLEEIEHRLAELMPTRTKTDGPFIYEDYTGEAGKQKQQEWDTLIKERERLEAMRPD